jgi:hypothetical protein
MHPNTIYALIRATIRDVLGGGVGQFEPRADENLETLYGLNITARRALFNPLNGRFAANGTPITPLLTPNSTADKDTVRKLRDLIGPRVPAIILAAMLVVLGGRSEAKTTIEDYNLDADRNSISYQEMLIYFSNKASISVEDFDANKNGQIDAGELTSLNMKIRALAEEEAAASFASEAQITGRPIESVAVDTALAVLNQERKKLPTAMEIAEAARQAEIESKKAYSDDIKFYLRKASRDVSIRADAFDGNGANFSFRSNEVTDVVSGRITAAFGALRELRLKDKFAPTGPYISAVTYGGSIAIDRSFDSRGGDFESRKLELRGGGDLEIANLVFPTQYLSAWAYLKSDTDFDGTVAGAEAIYEPFSFAFLNGFDVPGGRIIARFAPSLFAAYESVVDQGSEPLPYEEFFNLGYSLAAEIAWIRDSRRVVTLTSEYRDAWNALGNDERTYEWNNRLAWSLNEKGNVTLNVD